MTPQQMKFRLRTRMKANRLPVAPIVAVIGVIFQAVR